MNGLKGTDLKMTSHGSPGDSAGRKTELSLGSYEDNGTKGNGFHSNSVSGTSHSNVGGKGHGDGNWNRPRRTTTTVFDTRNGPQIVTSSSRSDSSSTSTATLNSVETTYRSTQPLEGPPKRNTNTLLAMTLPPAVAIFLLLTLSCFIILYKKENAKSSRKSKEDSQKSRCNGTRQERYEESGGRHISINHPESSLTQCADGGGHGKQKHHNLETEDTNCTNVQYEEVTENFYPLPERKHPHNKDIHDRSTGFKGRYRYEEIENLSRHGSFGYGEVIGQNAQGYNQGCKKGKHGESRDQGLKTSKVASHVNDTLNSDSPPNAPYNSVFVAKENGGYDTLDRLQNRDQPKSKTTSDYDITQRTVEGGVKIGQPGNSYSTISTVLMDAYAKLDRTTGRSQKVVYTCPSTYDELESRATSS